MTNGSYGFWADGKEIHADALKQELSEQVAALKKRQEVAPTAIEREQLDSEVEQAHATYKKKCAELPWLLF